MNAPERIWVDDERPVGGEVHVWSFLEENQKPYATEYLRKDLCELPSDNCRDWFYFPIEMPVTKAGWGPATVGLDADKITYCVWDKLFNEHGSFDNLYCAINEAMRLNRELEGKKTSV